VKTLVFLTSLGLGVLTSSAFAADVSIKGNVSETVEASDNYFLSNAPSGTTIKPTTAGTLDVLARTPTTNYLLDTNYSYYNYFGPGAADTSLTWGTPASATFSIDHTTDLAKYKIAASWTRVDAATTQLAQTGVATAHGSINTYSSNGSVEYDLGRIDRISWTAQGSNVSFTDPTQVPYDEVTTMLAWNHELSALTILTNSVSFDWFGAEDPAQNQLLFWKLMTGVGSELAPYLTFLGHVGVGFVNGYQSGAAQATPTPVPSGVALFPVGTANSILADATLTYRLLKDTKVSLTAAQVVAPTVTGQLQKSDTVGLAVDYTINSLSNLSFSTQFSYLPASQDNAFSTGQTGASNFISASVTYGYRLTREWRSNLTYTYAQRNDDTGLARSSTVLFSLARDFTLLGDPTAINQAEKERTRIRDLQSIGYVFPTFR